MSWPEATLAIITILCATVVIIAVLATREGKRHHDRTTSHPDWPGGRHEE